MRRSVTVSRIFFPSTCMCRAAHLTHTRSSTACCGYWAGTAAPMNRQKRHDTSLSRKRASVAGRPSSGRKPGPIHQLVVVLDGGSRLSPAFAGMTVSFGGVDDPKRSDIGVSVLRVLCASVVNRLKAAADLRHDFFGEDLQLIEGEAVRHARPMHRGDDMVDPEPAVQPDHLSGVPRRAAQP